MNENIELSEATLDDIVFENRNKSYGAFLLRKLYDKNVLISLGISIGIFSLVLALPVILKLLSPEEVVVIPVEEKSVVTIVDVPLEPLKEDPLPIPKVEPPKLKTIKFVPPEPAPDPEVNEPPPPPQEKLETANISNEDREGEDIQADLPPDLPVSTGIVDAEEGLWLGAVTKEASFPGGMAALHKYINSHMNPRAVSYAQDRGIKGKVWVMFEVKKDGTIENVALMKGRELPNCNICNESVVEVIKGMPKWSSAENNGSSVNRRIQIPISF